MSANLSMTSVSPAIFVRENLTCAIEIDTQRVPPCDQFALFRDAHQSVIDVDLIRSRGDSYPAHQIVWDLGKLVFTSTELPGKGYVHRWRHLQKPTLDHWYVTIPLRASERLPREGNVASPSLHCLAAPYETETEDDAFFTLFMPHDLLSSMPGLDVMRNMPVEGGCGLLIADYLRLLNRSLPNLKVTEVPHVVEATRSVIAACLAPSRDRFAEAQRPIDGIILDQARKAIARKLADPDLSPETLCAELGLSRSRLYRLFEPLGGVSTYIRHQRLVKTRDALCDRADRRSISRIAEEWGFMDPSAYSRTFRHEFGISPSEAREEGWIGNGYLAGQYVRHPADDRLTLADVLEGMTA